MNELQSVLSAWRASREAIEGAVLATVVHVRGSAYRRPGARMLLLPDGRRIGTISGGCLEGDVARKAAWWTSAGESVLRTFDNSAPDIAWEFGLGCNGEISLLLERAESSQVCESMEFLERQQANDQACAIATVIRAAPGGHWRMGDRAFWNAGGPGGGRLAVAGMDRVIRDALQITLTEEVSRLLHTADADIFVEWIGLPQRLVIFGTGHDVLPLVKFASILGWRTTVAQTRTDTARVHRLPGVENVITLPPSGDLASIPIDSRTAVVVMTHNFPQDVALVPQILQRDPRYLGLLGPRRRAEDLFQEIGVSLSTTDVHAPVGLDIGCDHPETIALSIIAEIQSVLSGRSSGSLRHRSCAMHAAVRECGEGSLRLLRGPENAHLETCEAAA